MTVSTSLPDAHTRRRIGPWHPDRLPSLSEFEADTNFLVRAAAGSGKTTSLVGRIVALVRMGVPLEECAAITFTRKAASEMRARLYAELREAQAQIASAPEHAPEERQRVAEAQSALPRCFIGTIHSFCARLLRERPLAAGLPPDFTAGLDDRDREDLQQQVWQSYLSDVWARNPEKVNQVVSLGIDPQDLTHFFGLLCRYPDLTPYVDGPETPPDLDGAVKSLREHVTRWSSALPDDPADGDAKPGTAADAVREAKRMLEVYPLNDPASKAAFVSLFDGITRTDRRKSTDTTIRGRITKGHWLDSDLASELDNELLPALEREIVEPALRQWRAYAHRQLVEFARPAVSRYAEQRRELGQLTFQDLLVHTRRLLRDNPDARRALQEQYPRLLVDEFQDTDPIQAEILFYLASRDPSTEDWKECRPRDGSLFIVGDDKQSIYRFRRADLDVYTEVRTTIDRASNGEDVTLESNFRSAPPLLSWCNNAFGELFGQLETPYQAQYVPFAAARSDAPADDPVLQLDVPYVKGESSTRKIARRNANQVARLIAAACQEDAPPTPLVGTSPGDFMVLTRNTTRLDEFAEAFAEQGLPYTLAGGDDVKASSELYALVTLLTCIERPGDPVARLAYLRGPLVGLSDDALYRYRRAGGQFGGPFSLDSNIGDALDASLKQKLEQAYAHLRHAQERLDALRPAPALEQTLDRLGLLARTRLDPGMGSLHAGRLLRVLTEVQRLDADGHSWTEIRDELQQILDGDRSLDGLTLETGATDAVRLLNVHKAKGLEAPVVFLADPYGGTHPKSPTEHVRRDEGDVVLPVYEKHRYNRTLRFAPERWAAEFEETEAQYQRAEEDRLLYVAATRAEEQVVLSRYRSPSWSTEKGFWAPLYDFLEEVPQIDPPPDASGTRREGEHTLPTVVGPEEWDAIEEPTYRTTTVTDTPQEEWRPTLGDGYGSRFGTALHRLFEYAIQRRNTPLRPIERSSAIDAILSADDAAEHRDSARRMLDAFLDSRLWESIQTAKAVHTEFPVAGLHAAECPTITEGTIDLLYQREGQWHLVDFKSDRIDEADVPSVRRQYRDQLQQYTTLWTDATDAPLADLSLWLAHLGRSVSVEWEPSP